MLSCRCCRYHYHRENEGMNPFDLRAVFGVPSTLLSWTRRGGIHHQLENAIMTGDTRRDARA